MKTPPSCPLHVSSSFVQVSPDIVHDTDPRCFKFSSKSYKIVGPGSQFVEVCRDGAMDIMVASVITCSTFGFSYVSW